MKDEANFMRMFKIILSAAVVMTGFVTGCGAEDGTETQEGFDEIRETPETLPTDESEREVGAMEVRNNEYCWGESSHTVDTVSGTVTWRFWTRNDGYNRRLATVSGRVYHSGSGFYLECRAGSGDDPGESVVYNSCEIVTPLTSGYNSSGAHHRCCMRKGLFNSWQCRETDTTDHL
jgi:hypothetical protein